MLVLNTWLSLSKSLLEPHEPKVAKRAQGHSLNQSAQHRQLVHLVLSLGAHAFPSEFQR